MVRLDQADFLLGITLHHIICDGWSSAILLRELAELYAAISEGRPSPLPALPLQYADYAVWQQRSVRGDALARGLAYWRAQLDGLATLRLPTDRPRPPLQSFRGSRCPLVVPTTLVAKLRDLGLRSRTTLFMTLLAAFQTLLHRLSDQDDIAVGTPLANRDRAELEGLIGFFVNTVVMRTDLSGDPPFSDLLGRVRRTALEAYRHQDVPFDRLVEELHPQRDLSRNPLFQVIFQVFTTGNSGGGDPAPASTDPPPISMVDIDAASTKFDLRLDLAESPDGLAGFVEYSTDLFDRATIDRLIARFDVLLRGIAAAPDQRLSQLPLLPPDEHHRLLIDWNDTARDYPRESRINELYEQQAERAPDAVALIGRDVRLTYRELDQRANRLAHHLVACGVEAGSLVGVSGVRSAEAIVSLLAIVKAGAAYVPLDPDEPAERTRVVAETAGIRVFVTTSEHLGALSTNERTVVHLPRDAAAIAGGPATPVPVSGGALSPAYVMHTSGSTGIPKGVCIPHRAIVRLVRGSTFLPWSHHDVFLQAAPLAFDASTLEIWGALLNGGTLALLDPGVPSVESLRAAIARYGVTTLWLTSGLFRSVVEEDVQALAPLRHLLAGGDILPVSAVRRVLSALPHLELINGYGPTENTTFTCTHPVSADDDLERGVPIGRPIANTRVYVLDRIGRLSPIGVPGELFTGGDGVALGYLDTRLDGPAFVPDAFGTDPDARLYRTGDIVRWRDDGVLEFLGRADRQVKIRGFRVELEAIEAVLAQHPAVDTAICVMRDDGGDPRLVAYVVPADGRATDNGDLRGFVATRLPAYMVPAKVVVMSALPLNRNGKLDRDRLPAPDAPRTDAALVQASSDLEKLIAGLWQEALRVEQIGVEENFFDLGGHSLLVIQLHHRLRGLGFPMPIVDFFRFPTVRSLARALGVAKSPAL